LGSAGEAAAREDEPHAVARRLHVRRGGRRLLVATGAVHAAAVVAVLAVLAVAVLAIADVGLVGGVPIVATADHVRVAASGRERESEEREKGDGENRASHDVT